jgi:dihydrofolate reductase
VGQIIESTLVSVDGVFDAADIMDFLEYHDDAYMRDGLGLAMACEAWAEAYQVFANAWPKRTDPWAQRINSMPKFVFSSTLASVDWANTTIVRDGVADEVAEMKAGSERPLLVYGHGLFGEALLRQRLLDVLDLAIHPIFLGSGRHIFREDQRAKMTLIASKSYTRGVVKLTFGPQ